MVSATILGMLLVAIFLIYRMGAASMMRADAETELTQNAQILSRNFAKDVEQTVYDSVSLAPDNSAVAFLSGIYGSDFQVDSAGNPLWQKYVVYYHDRAQRRVFRQEVSLPAGASQIYTPAPIDTLAGLDVTSYATGGDRIADNIYGCSFELDFQPPTNTPILLLRVDARKARYGNTEEEMVQVDSAVRMRN